MYIIIFGVITHVPILIFLYHPVGVKCFSPGRRPGLTNNTPTPPSPEAGEGGARRLSITSFILFHFSHEFFRFLLYNSIYIFFAYFMGSILKWRMKSAEVIVVIITLSALTAILFYSMDLNPFENLTNENEKQP